jgi:hypothetical protein
MPEEPEERYQGGPASGQRPNEPGQDGHVQLSHWDTGMKMETTPQSTIDHWGEPAALSPADPGGPTPPDSTEAEPTPPDPQNGS